MMDNDLREVRCSAFDFFCRVTPEPTGQREDLDHD